MIHLTPYKKFPKYQKITINKNLVSIYDFFQYAINIFQLLDNLIFTALINVDGDI
jgi:hypothetical protein